MYSFTNIDLTSVFMCFDDQDLPADLESNHIPSFSESKGCKIYSPPARYCGSVEKDYIRIAFGTPNPQENLLLEHGVFFSICSSEELSANWNWTLSQISWLKSLFWPWKTYENCDISSGPSPFSETNHLPCGDSDADSLHSPEGPCVRRGASGVWRWILRARKKKWFPNGGLSTLTNGKIKNKK